MTHEYLLWISLFSYAAHIYEEAVLDWKNWAESVSKLKNIQWRDFYIANGAVVVLGICSAMVGWQLPAFSLILPSLQLINAIFFHILPTLFLRKFSPGVITSCLLFVPIALWCYWGAWIDGALTLNNGVLSLVFAVLILAMPYSFLRLQKKISH